MDSLLGQEDAVDATGMIRLILQASMLKVQTLAQQRIGAGL
jgi:hypothetical protein